MGELILTISRPVLIDDFVQYVKDFNQEGGEKPAQA